MFDAHCHVDQLPDSAVVLDRARAAGVEDVLVAGVSPAGWRQQLALQRDGVHLALGLHPWAVAETPEGWQEELEGHLDASPIVAIGETGLDFGKRVSPDSFPAQVDAFKAHLVLAERYALPIVLHVVSAHVRMLELLSEVSPLSSGGMVHAFSGSAEQALQYVRHGLHVSICGAVTDPRRRKLRRAVEALPSDRILVETDAPDQTPIDRRPDPNEPAFLIDVVAAVAEARGETPEAVARQTTQNAKRLFRIR